MSGINKNSFHAVRLRHTGEVVNLATEDGANKFLMQCENKDDFDFFSLDLERAAALRKKGKRKGKLNAANRKNLEEIYNKFRAILQSCDRDVFQERVPDREVSTWMNHAADNFQELSQDDFWIRTGTLLKHDHALLASCSLLFIEHPVATVMAFEHNSFLESISALILARKGASLDPSFAHMIETIVANMHSHSCTPKANGWSPEKTFKKLEASGILKDYILCAAVKLPDKEAPTMKGFILDQLVNCVALVNERFKEGTPTGDSLRTILDGGKPVCPLALPYLQSLLKLSNSASEGIKTIPICWHCKKIYQEHDLMECARCRLICYCSKDCQRADWKQHKAKCKPGLKTRYRSYKAVSDVVDDFAERHYVDIMAKMVEESEQAGGLKMKEMVMMLDFIPDANGHVPILQDTPQFTVFPNSKCIELAVEMGRSNKDSLEELTTSLGDRSFSDLLSLCHMSDTSCFHPNSAIYTEAALEAFRLALHHGKYDPLVHLFHTENRWIPIREEIERLRLMKKSGDGDTT